MPRVFAILFLLVGLAGCASVQDRPILAELKDDSPFAAGVDLSLLQHLERHGVVFKENGQPKDALQIFREHGVNWVRLRLFVDPDGREGQVNSLPYTLQMARRVKSAGCRLLLDFHYSDQWADPEHQSIPPRWIALSRPQLTQAVHDYTLAVMTTFADAGVTPEMVQIGNECRHGILWPVGGDLSEDARKWDAFADLLKAGIAGVRESPGGKNVRVMIHVESGGDAPACRKFYDHLVARQVPFDVIGLSYYPVWQGPIMKLEKTLSLLSQRYRRSIIVVEAGAEWSPVPPATPSRSPYPPTPQGQQRFLQETIRAVQSTPGGRGKGVFYWAPEWIDARQWDGPAWSKEWEHRALFRPDGEVLPAVRAFESANAK
jgi:arabinogalactan endo-1,4-beta-galactosidase